MAQTGMTGWRGKHATEGGDDVVSSIELLDKVLSEFDDLDGNGNAVATASCSTAEAESPSLGHQSEDDGYMSMNGRRTKFAPNIMPLPDHGSHELPPAPDSPPTELSEEMADFPPPPEEAERVISYLLPRVSPASSLGKSSPQGSRACSRRLFTPSADLIPNGDCSLSPAQTTLPNMRQPNVFWENGSENGSKEAANGRPFHLIQPRKFASLPYENSQHSQRIPPTWCYRSGPLPPRTVANATDRHREVRRSPATSRPPPHPHPHGRPDDEDPSNFSDDSLDGELARQRGGSIAWEVPLDERPGSCRVVGRRHRRSSEGATSNGSPSPPPAMPLDLTFNGTYVIRKGRNRERPQLLVRGHRQTSLDSQDRTGNKQLKRTSSTFDNLKEIVKEGCNSSGELVRVLSLPVLGGAEIEEPPPTRNIKTNERYSKVTELGVTLEEAEDDLSSLDNPSLNSAINGYDTKPLPVEPVPKKGVEVETQTDLSDAETQNELELVGKQIREISKTKSELEEVEKKIQEIVKIKTTLEKERENNHTDPWVPMSDLRNERKKENGDFNVEVQVLQHIFPPLPPSPPPDPAEDHFDSYPSPLFRFPPLPSTPHSQPPRRKADTLPEPLMTPLYRCAQPAGSDPGACGRLMAQRPQEPLPPGAVAGSLKTRSMDARAGCRRDMHSDRRAHPSELQPPLPPSTSSRRRTLQKRSSSTSSPQDAPTSCSLPETPIFARGCDIPRTPHRAAVEGAATTSKRGSASNAGQPATSLQPSGPATGELLRLAGGPARGWYPRQRQPRPASSEHLDRLPHAWDATTSRKPMTLPPHVTPHFFHRGPRDALRRVTSLLIRGKGSTTKDAKRDFLPTNTAYVEEAETGARQKRGFFRWWKKSRRYSLDPQ